MYNKYIIVFVSLILIGCTNNLKETPNESVIENEVKKEVKTYPAEIQSVFDAHGGVDLWNSMKTLSYTFGKSSSEEKQIVDLKSRKIRIEQDKFNIGFDGDSVWVEALDTNTYTGDARFYHNLYFYFFAMPFVLGDEGIQYETSKPLMIDSVNYPGIKISYDDNIGDSPEDNYFLYYNEETKLAEWLGYTVTYFDGKPSSEIHYLHFETWGEINGLTLPTSLHWYILDEKSNTKKSRGQMNFKNITLSTKPVDEGIFRKK